MYFCVILILETLPIFFLKGPYLFFYLHSQFEGIIFLIFLLTSYTSFSYPHFQDETAVRLADASIQSPEYRLINVFVNFYSGKLLYETRWRTSITVESIFTVLCVSLNSQASEYPFYRGE